MWEDILGIQFGLLGVWGSGGLGLFTTSLMWTDEDGRWLFRNVHHILQYVVEWT